MQAISYYLGYPFIYLLSVLPFRAIYGISDVLTFLVRLIGYRREVIRLNLSRSFPEKSQEEIRLLRHAYYQYMCDLTLETFKMMRMSEEEVRHHIQVLNPEVAERFAQRNQSMILALGHYGNWEWYGGGFQLAVPHQIVIIYRPLTNAYFDKMLQRQRTRFGIEVTTMQQSMRTMLSNKDRLTATAFVGDQAAPVNAHWMTFLNQDSSVYTGIEKMARKLNYPVLYIHAKRPRRGYYTLEMEILSEEPTKTKDNEITELFTRRLEKDIRENPDIWLWSHKRWKIQRPTS